MSLGSDTGFSQNRIEITVFMVMPSAIYADKDKLTNNEAS